MNIDMLEAINEEYKQRMLKWCSPVFKAFSATQIHYVRVYQDGRFCAINSVDTILKRWLQNGHFKQDALLKCPSITYDIIVPWTIKHYPGLKESSMQEVMLGSDVNQGIAFIYKDALGYVNFSFGTSDTHSSWLSRINNESQNIINFIKHTQEKIEPTFKAISKDMVNILEHKNEDYLEKNNPSLVLDKISRMDFLISSGVLDKTDEYLLRVNLGYRETQCAMWYLNGITAFEGSTITGLSMNSIAGYYNDLKRKLKITFKKELSTALRKLQAIGGLDLHKKPNNPLHRTLDIENYDGQKHNTSIV